MKKHHNDLFLFVDSLYSQIRPKLKEFFKINRDSRKKIFLIWEDNLLKSGLGHDCGRIAEDLVTTINPHNVVSLLLNEKDEETKETIKACIRERTSQKTWKEINLDEISQPLIEKAKPEVAELIDTYKELKEQNDKKVKGKLLPLLQKYISNPV